MMLTLADYLELSVQDARRQWVAIRQRMPVGPGSRQVDFTPLETLVCFGLGLVAPPSRNETGTINLQVSSPDVQRFAALFKRSPKSLASKLNNLDGRRPHGARFEQELWIELTLKRDVFPSLYEIILRGARDAGLSPQEVPDFLGLKHHDLEVVYDAVTVSDDELFASVDRLLSRPGAELAGDPVLTGRALVGTARVGQQQFARRVLTRADFHCVFCGLSTRAHNLPSSRMLVASHIKPWSESSGRERLDPENGLAACPTHDAAFENHLIATDGAGRILLSTALARAVERDPAWWQFFGPKALAPRLLIAADARPGLGYVDWHRASTGDVSYASGLAD